MGLHSENDQEAKAKVAGLLSIASDLERDRAKVNQIRNLAGFPYFGYGTQAAQLQRVVDEKSKSFEAQVQEVRLMNLRPPMRQP